MSGKESEDRSKCSIQNTVRVICPKCGKIIVVPMHQAVNGEKISCSDCQFEFEFRLP